ncbi:MAG: cyclic nucleotide-binding domain-containing protein [Cyanobacteria bacterium J06638_28]
MERVLFVLGILEDEDIDWLVSAGYRQEVDREEILIQEGEPNAAIYLILSGCFVVSSSGASPIEIARLLRGEVVGEMSFIDHLPPSATVTATEASVVLAINRGVLEQKLSQDLGFAYRWYHALAMLLSTRLRDTVRHLEGPRQRSASPEAERFAPEMADNMRLGEIRFDWLMRRLRDIDVHNWET